VIVGAFVVDESVIVVADVDTIGAASELLKKFE
jgi:hypothetical protein